MLGKSALILGATGSVGKHLLRSVLSSNVFTRVGEYGRKVTPEEQLSEYVPTGKLVQKVIDFDQIKDAELGKDRWDVVFVTLGTTKQKAGSATAFEKIDREYVLNAARAAISEDQGSRQRIVYLSSAGANPSAHALYLRSKGLTEQGLASLGYGDVIVFRPTFLAEAEREKPLPFEPTVQRIANFLAKFSSSVQVPVKTLAESMRLAGELGSSALPPDVQTSNITLPGQDTASFTVLNNSAILKLATNAESPST